MSDQAYDKKNQEDFDANSQALADALDKIAQDKKLKPTIAQLSKLTGIHRNTISERGWPKERLEKISNARDSELARKKKKAEAKGGNTKELLQKSLDQTQQEVVFWFNEYQDTKKYFDHKSNQFEKMRDSRDYYLKELESERKKSKDLQIEVDQLKDIIETINNK